MVYPELSYQINGVLFQVHNKIGRYCNEKQVCDCIEQYLKDNNIQYERELVLSPHFNGEKNGRNRIDFLIVDSIILEVKCKRFITKEDYYQTQRYLHSFNKKLAIIVNFRDERLKPRRVLNPQYRSIS